VPSNQNFALASGIIVHNSKDIIDAVAGSIWACSQNIQKAGTVIDSRMLVNTLTSAITKLNPQNELETLFSKSR